MALATKMIHQALVGHVLVYLKKVALATLIKGIFVHSFVLVYLKKVALATSVGYILNL